MPNINDEICGFAIEEYDEDEYRTPPWIDDDSNDSEFGCCFPSECVMPGPHMRSECATAEMMQAMYEAGEA